MQDDATTLDDDDDEDDATTLVSYLQGKSFSLMQSAIQFSRLGTRPRFFAYWTIVSW